MARFRSLNVFRGALARFAHASAPRPFLILGGTAWGLQNSYHEPEYKLKSPYQIIPRVKQMRQPELRRSFQESAVLDTDTRKSAGPCSDAPREIETTTGTILRTTPVFDTYWRFAALRQDIFMRRLSRTKPPWSDDPILSTYRFTNPYRASDRVSQYLIHRGQLTEAVGALDRSCGLDGSRSHACILPCGVKGGKGTICDTIVKSFPKEVRFPLGKASRSGVTCKHNATFALRIQALPDGSPQ